MSQATLARAKVVVDFPTSFKRRWAQKDSDLGPIDYESNIVVSKTLEPSVNTVVLRIPALHLLYLSGLE